MALPIWVTWFANLTGAKGDQGETGEKGDTGTFASTSATTVPYGSPARATMYGPESARSVIFEVPAGAPGANSVPTEEAIGAFLRQLGLSFSAFGDSLTEGFGLVDPADFPAPNAWPGVLANVLEHGAITVSNKGRSGWTAADIAVLQGSIPLYLTAAGNMIPASGPVTVTVLADYGGTIGLTVEHGLHPTSGRSWLGEWVGVDGTVVQGTLLKTDENTFRFTRTTAGAAVTVAAQSRFTTDADVSARSTSHIIFVGRNDFTNNVTGPHASIEAHVFEVSKIMAAYAPAGRFLVIGPTTKSSEAIGSTLHTKILVCNDMQRDYFGSRYLDAQSYFSGDAIYDQGIPVTSADLAALNQLTIPPSLVPDTTHFTAATHAQLAGMVQARLVALGALTARTTGGDWAAPSTPPNLSGGVAAARYHSAKSLEGDVGAPVTSWPDLGTADTALAATSSTTAPRLRTRAGMPFVAFDGADDALRSPWVQSQPLTIAIVAKMRNPSGTVAITSDIVLGSNVNSGVQRYFIRQSGSGYLTSVVADDGWHIILASVNGAGTVLRVDGVEQVVSPGSGGMTALDLAVNQAGTSREEVDVAAVLAYPAAANLTDRNAIVDYLRAEWGDLLGSTAPAWGWPTALPITGAERYHSARSLTTIDATVQEWADLGTEGTPLVADSSSTSPRLRVTGESPWLEFDGVDDVLRSLYAQAQPVTIAVVAKIRNPVGTVSITSDIVLGTNVNGGVQQYFVRQTGSGFLTTLVANDGWHVFIASVSGAGTVLRADSTEATVSPGVGAMTRLDIATNQAGTARSAVNVAAVVTIPRAIDATERATLTAFLHNEFPDLFV